MASGAQGNQVLFGIIAALAAKFLMVNFKIRHHTARLASPAIAAKNLIAKLVVQFTVQAEARVLWSRTIHEAFSVM